MVPKDHILRGINVFVTSALNGLHKELGRFYSDIGRPSIDPERRYERQPPKVISPSDPQSAWTAKANKRVQFGYGLNYLIDIENAMIVDVEATPARTYDEVAATQTMLERTQERFDLKPKRLAADMAYGTGKFLGWQVKIKKIIPHIPVARRTKACRDALHAFEDPSWLRADAAQGTFRGTRRIPFSRHRAEPQNAGAPDPSAATNAISRIARLNSHMDHSSFPTESLRSTF